MIRNGVSNNLRRLHNQRAKGEPFRFVLRFFETSLLLRLVVLGLLLFLWSSAAFTQELYGSPERRGDAFSVLSNPPGVSVALKGEDFIVGTTPFRISDLTEGVYKVKVSKGGYESQIGRLMIVPNRGHVLTAKFTPVSRARILLRSAVLPGWGQFHSGNKVKGTVWATLQASALVAALLQNSQYKKAVDDHYTSVERYRNATNIEDIKQSRLEMRQKSQAADKAYDDRQITLALAAGIWAFNVLDTAFLSPTLRANTIMPGSVTFNLSPKTRTKAILRSALLPGWGQFYSGRKTAGILYGLSGLSSAAAAVLANSNYQKIVDDLEDAKGRYMSATAIEDIERYGAEMDVYNKDADRAFTFRQVTLGLLIAVWAYNILDSAIASEQSSLTGQQLTSSFKKSFIYAQGKDDALFFGIKYHF